MQCMMQASKHGRNLIPYLAARRPVDSANREASREMVSIFAYVRSSIGATQRAGAPEQFSLGVGLKGQAIWRHIQVRSLDSFKPNLSVTLPAIALCLGQIDLTKYNVPTDAFSFAYLPV